MMIASGDPDTLHDFRFFNASRQAWNGTAFVNWSDASYATTAQPALEIGLSGRYYYDGTPPTGATSWDLRPRLLSGRIAPAVDAGDLEVATSAGDAATSAASADTKLGTPAVSVSADIAAVQTSATAIKATTDANLDAKVSDAVAAGDATAASQLTAIKLLQAKD